MLLCINPYELVLLYVHTFVRLLLSTLRDWSKARKYKMNELQETKQVSVLITGTVQNKYYD